MKVYKDQLDALHKHRKKAHQTMKVEHGHVNEGGQAVVGIVEKGGGSEDE